jgi:fused signal recognition particle receptor
MARTARLDLKNIRVDIEKRRKELGEWHLRKTQKINGDAKKLKDLIEPYEAKLLEIEEYAERQEQQRKAKLAQERAEKILAVEGNVAGISLGDLEEEQFADMLKGATLVFEAKKEELRKAEEARVAKEKADKEEQERIRLENERLKKEAEEQEKILAQERIKAQIATEEVRKERESAEAKHRADALKALLEQRRIEAQAKAAQELADKKAKEERIAREKLEAEIAAQKKAQDDELSRQEALRKKAAAAPDKEKILAFASVVKALKMVNLTTDKGKTIQAEIAAKTVAFSKWIENKTTELE